MKSTLHWKGGRPGNWLSIILFNCFTVQYDSPSLSMTFEDELVMSDSDWRGCVPLLLPADLTLLTMSPYVSSLTVRPPSHTEK